MPPLGCDIFILRWIGRRAWYQSRLNWLLHPLLLSPRQVVLEEDEGLLPGALAGLGDEGGAYDEVDEAFLATLSTKEKKLLLKRLKEQAAGGGVGEGEGEEGKGRKRRKREKDKKRSKKVCGLLGCYLV